MATLFGTDTHRLIYKALNFVTGLTVTAYIWNAALVQSALQTFTEVSDGLYYLDYNFAAAGTSFGKFYEGGVATISGTFRIDTKLDGLRGTDGKAILSTDAQDLSATLGVDAKAISGSTTAADNMEASAKTIVVAAAAAGTLSTTEMTTNLAEITDDHYNGRIVIFTSGVLKDQATDITDYDGATKKLTYTALTEAPTAADTFVIV